MNSFPKCHLYEILTFSVQTLYTMSLTFVRGVIVLFCVINVSTLNSSCVFEEEACSLLSHVFLRERVFMCVAAI